MFKIIKSKRGFTLVELMIVVAILAILVAAAVPIYSSVTKNARIKTCENNRREIAAQLNNYAMGSLDGKLHTRNLKATSFIDITTFQDGTVDVMCYGNGYDFISSEDFVRLFREVPRCPKDTGVIVVEISENGIVESVRCTSHTGGNVEKEFEGRPEITPIPNKD